MSRLSRRRNINALIVATAIAVLLYFLLSYSESGTPPVFSTPPEVNRQAEFYINNTRMTQFDEQGILDAMIISEHIEQNPQKNSIDMNLPRISVFNQGKLSWSISADLGSIYDNGEIINLEQQVKAVSSDRLTLLKTPFLVVQPNKKTANTDRPVTLVSHNGVTRAIGLQADLNIKQIELLSKVRGQYEPKAVSVYVD
jgi:lipopolysaccharide export system protein LptC